MYNYSIIIPYRDTYDMLVKAVDSIPDRSDIQVIIVDNGTELMPKEGIPRRKDATVDYYTSSPLKGAGCARNEGLSHAEGKFLLFLDADDYFTPNAFNVFDKYLKEDYDVIYFQTDSININDGSRSCRHNVINNLVSTYLKNGDDGLLRYRFVNPVAKMIRSEFVLKNRFKFDEIKVSNDVWFSLMTGHSAKNICADEAVVYMITADDNGNSLTRIRTKEIFMMRYQVMVRVNQFLKSVDKYNYRIHLMGALRIAFKDYGIGTFWEALCYAKKCKVGIL